MKFYIYIQNDIKFKEIDETKIFIVSLFISLSLSFSVSLYLHMDRYLDMYV